MVVTVCQFLVLIVLKGAVLDVVYRLCRTDIFVFLLSTRAGGLGINLTAADTVRPPIQYLWNFYYNKKFCVRVIRIAYSHAILVNSILYVKTVRKT